MRRYADNDLGRPPPDGQAGAALLPRAVKRLLQSRFFRFLLVGGLNTLFGYGVYALLILLHAHYALAALIGQVCGVLFNFKTTGILVFGSHDNRLIFKFVGVYCVTYLLNVGALKLFAMFKVNMLLAGAVLLLPMAVVAFTLNRQFVFGGANARAATGDSTKAARRDPDGPAA